jgi:hypothetical protein
MKRLLLLTAIFLTACGPSQEEKEEIAIITCNIMGESRNMDGAVRIKEINAAREKLGEDAFLGSDDAIKQSFEYGLCKELVVNDDYETKLEAALLAELARLEAELVEIERKKKEAPSKWRTAVLAQIEGYKPVITDLQTKSYGWGEIFVTCLNGLYADLIVKLRDEMGQLTQTIIENGTDSSTCDSEEQSGAVGYLGNKKGLFRINISKDDLVGKRLSADSIVSAEMIVKGFYEAKAASVNKKISHKYLDEDHVIDPPIILPVSIEPLQGEVARIRVQEAIRQAALDGGVHNLVMDKIDEYGPKSIQCDKVMLKALGYEVEDMTSLKSLDYYYAFQEYVDKRLKSPGFLGEKWRHSATAMLSLYSDAKKVDSSIREQCGDLRDED